MQMSIERFLIVNLLLDGALLVIVARACGSFRILKVICISILCALYAFAAIAHPNPWASPMIQSVMLIIISILIIGKADKRRWPAAAMFLIAGAILIGGTESLFSSNSTSSLPGIAAGIMITAFLFAMRSRMRATWHVELLIILNDRTARIRALIDTGNRLHEPLSGLPVIIAEERLVERIMPEYGYRHVSYGALGGSGVLPCFRPDEIWIIEGRKKHRAPEAWIGISDIPLPGPARALAPGKFAAIP